MKVEVEHHSLAPDLMNKYEALKQIISEMGQVVVGYSGGVDSTVVMKVAHDQLGDNAIAVTGDSEAFPAGEVDAALEVAHQMGIEVVRVRTHELSNIHFRINNPDRCYHCKTELFSELRQVADERNIQWILDGSHADDEGDHRPGMKAAAERNVRSPLREARIHKHEIRDIAKFLGLSNWDKPSFACLSSRFPYGTTITPELLERLDKCERVLRDLGFRQFRVRHHDTICRIEVEVRDMLMLLENRDMINDSFKALGYKYVTMDIEGYRSGKMNDPIRDSQGLIRIDALRKPA